ncbi:NB-ARC domain-containing protein [Streptomyces sp. NBC_00386]|uniref:NB-ARC domain-containing protein n=1 Tax=Streptomyces sp. NBC_00386 TaxID=2975734 RepID=UPI002E1D9DFF
MQKNVAGGGEVRVRLWSAGVVALAVLGIVLSLLLALAGNPATAADHWPWPLDELRQHSWRSVAVFGTLATVAGGTAAWLQLRPPAVVNDPLPPSPVTMPDWFVDRSQTRATVSAVCRRGRAVAITTALLGAGGFGKTTLAEAVCANRRVRQYYRSRIYLVTIGRDVRGRAAVAAKVSEVTRFITGDTEEFDDPALAGAHLGRLLDQRPRTLLVLDDVWETEQLEPFLHGGRSCVRLVTTRKPDLLPPGARRIQVDQMSHAQARNVLTWNLPSLPAALVDALLQATGRWALLLRLTNRLITEQCASGADPTSTAEQILHRLCSNGPAAVDDPAGTWNLDDPHLRNQVAQASIEASTTLLPPGGPDRFTELGIFAEDESIPVPVIALLWQASSGLTEEQARTLCRNLERLSLLTLSQVNGGTISLHDVVRDYLRNKLGADGLARVNRLLLDTVAATLPPAQALATRQPNPERAWWRLTDGYLLDHLISHFLAAGHTTLAEAVAGDLRWVETRLIHRGPTAPWSDLARIDTPHTRPLARSLAQAAHLLTLTEPSRGLTNILHTRLDSHPHWRPQITAHHYDPAQRPCLATRWPLPDAPSSALQRNLTGHTSLVRAVAVGSDGTWLTTGSGDGTVQVWDRVTGTCIAILTGHTGWVWSVAVSPDGAWLASASEDRTVRVWDRATGTCIAILTGHSDAVKAVAFSPDGAWLATASDDRTVRVWDRVTGSRITTLTGHTKAVNAVAVSPDGAWLATASDDRTVRVWDQVTGTCTAILTGHANAVKAVAVSLDGTWLATGSSDRTVRVWDRGTGTCIAILTGHSGWVWSVAVSPDGAWLATASSDGTVRVWDRGTGTCIAILTGHSGWVWSVAVSRDGTWLATTTDETVQIWDPEVAAHISSTSAHTGWVDAVAVGPDGTWLAIGGGDGMVRVWDRVTGTCTVTITAHILGVKAVAVGPDGTWLVSAGDGMVRVWDRVTGTCTVTITDSVNAVAVGSDGTWLVSAGDGMVRVWDRVTGTCIAILTGHTDAVNAVAVGPDGTWLATGGIDRTVRVWDRVTGTCIAILTGHTDAVNAVAVSPDGTWLATASDDQTVRVWDRATGTCIAILTGHTDAVNTVAVSPDGAWLATASDDQTVRIWSTADRRTVAVTRAEERLTSCAWGAGHELAVGGVRGLYLFVLLT